MEMGDNHRERIMFLVTDTGNYDILLGTDWLRAHCHDSLLYKGSEDDDELGLEVTG